MINPRWVWLACMGAVVVVGCTAPPTPPVASVAGATLRTDRLAELMVLGQPLPIEEDTGLRLANHWVEITAVARAVSEGRALTGPSALDVGMAWDLREAAREQYLARRVPLPTAPQSQIDSVFAVGEWRLIAHMLRAASPRASRDEQRRQQASAQAIVDSIGKGGSWEWASEANEDEATRGSNGIMGVFLPGELPGPMDRVAFSLQEGEVSGVTPSPVGFHVLYRPRMEDVRPQFRRLLTQRLAEDGRRRLSDDLLEQSGFRMVDGALDRVRALVRDPYGAAEPAEALGEYDQWPTEGADAPPTAAPMTFTVADAAMAVGRLSADTRMEMTAAPSGQLRTFLTRLAANHLVWQTARARGLEPDDADRATIDARFRADVARVRQALEASGPLTGGRFETVVDQYFEAFLARRRDQVSVPPGLARYLLTMEQWSVSDEAIARAVGEARVLYEAAAGT